MEYRELYEEMLNKKEEDRRGRAIEHMAFSVSANRDTFIYVHNQGRNKISVPEGKGVDIDCRERRFWRQDLWLECKFSFDQNSELGSKIVEESKKIDGKIQSNALDRIKDTIRKGGTGFNLYGFQYDEDKTRQYESFLREETGLDIECFGNSRNITSGAFCRIV